jgi:hypothetical protein
MSLVIVQRPDRTNFYAPEKVCSVALDLDRILRTPTLIKQVADALPPDAAKDWAKLLARVAEQRRRHRPITGGDL